MPDCNRGSGAQERSESGMNLRLTALLAVVAVVALVLGVLDQPALGQSAPSKPTGLTASADSATSVSLDWDDPSDTSITGYKVERRVGNTGTFTEVEDDTGSSTTSYTDDTVGGDTTYQYRVKAVNANGDSPASDAAEVRTPPESVWTADLTVGSEEFSAGHHSDNVFYGYSTLTGAIFGTFTDDEFDIGDTTYTVSVLMYGWLVSDTTYQLYFVLVDPVEGGEDTPLKLPERFKLKIGDTEFDITDADYDDFSDIYKLSAAASPFPADGETVAVELATSFPGVTIDTDTGTEGVQTDALSVTEEGTATYTVVLDSEPTGDVTVTPTLPDGLSVSPTSLSFTRDRLGVDGDWDTAKTFTVTAEADNDLADASGLEITHEVTGYGSITSADTVTVNVTDNDTAGITISPTALTVNEESTATYTVVLDFQPSTDVTVTLTQPTNTDVTADTDTGTTGNQTTLTFTDSNWDTAQTVTVSAADDTDRANEMATISHAATQSGTTGEYHGITVGSVSVTVNDNDIITLSTSSITVEEGGSGTTYTVVLAQAPTGNVTVSLSASSAIGLTFDTGPADGIQTTPLTFTTTNWDQAQTVTIAATDDDDGFDNTGTITHTVSGGGLSGTSRLSTTVTDDEDVELVFGGSVSLNTNETPDDTSDDVYEMSVTEDTDSGASNQYTVKLSSQPFPTNQNVTVRITAPTGLLTLKKAGQATATKFIDLTFTGSNWNTAQTVTVVADDDDDHVDATGISVTHVASGANFGSVSEPVDFTVEDDDSPGLVMSRTKIDVTETNAAVTATYTVKLATVPTETVTVTLTQPTNTDVTVDTNTTTDGNQNTLEFTTSNWNTAQTVTVSIAADADAANESATITSSASQEDTTKEYHGVTGAAVSLNINDDELANVTGVPSSLSSREPTSGTVTVPFKIKLSAPPTSAVTVTPTVAAVTPPLVAGQAWTNPDVSLPASVTLNSSNWSAGVDVNVTLSTDDDAENDVVRITYTVAQTGGSMEYDGYSIAATTLTITDPETPKVQFKESTETSYADGPDVDMDDGGTMNLDVRLTHRPRSNATVTVSVPSGSGLAVTPASRSLTFTPNAWTSTQSMQFTFSHTEDDDAFSQVYKLDFSVSGYGSDATVQDLDLTVTDTDDVSASIGHVAPDTSVPDTVDEQDATGIKYKITLASRPSTSTGAAATVSVDITSNNPDVTASPDPVVLNSSNWEDGVVVTVKAANDADGADESVTLSHAATSQVSGANGDYHNVSIDDVVLTIDDNDTPAVQFHPDDTEVDSTTNVRSIEFTEAPGLFGARTTYRIRVSTEPTDEVQVTASAPDAPRLNFLLGSSEEKRFTSANYRTYQTITITTLGDNDTADDTATIQHAVTQDGTADEYEGIAVDNVILTIVDPDRSSAVLTSGGSILRSLTVLEESTATYDVTLSHKPASGDELTVTLTVTGTGTPITVDTSTDAGNQNTLTFDSTNWNTAQQVTVTGVADTNLVNDSFTIRHAVTGTRASAEAVNLGVTRTDNDAPNLDLGGTTNLTISEGGSSSYDIKLTQQPSANVTLTVTATGNTDVKFSVDTCTTLTNTGTLTFTDSNWETAQSLTVCGAEDYDASDDTANLTYSASGGGYGSLNYPNTPVTVTDNDSESITVSPSSVDITEIDGGVGTGTYNVSLSAAPTGGNVTITVNVTDNTDITTNPRTLTFAPGDWDTAGTQTVTKSVEIRVADDAGAGDDTANIGHTQSGVSYEAGTGGLGGVRVNVTDTDTRAVVFTADDPFEFNEGGSKTYTVRLDTEPTGTVTVGVQDTDASDDIRVDKTALQFTVRNWNTPQTVRVSADADDDAADDTTTINHPVSGADYGANNVTADSLDVTVTDLSVRAVTVDTDTDRLGPQDELVIGEGFTDTYEVVLGTQPVGGTVTVMIASDNSDVTVSPSSLDFDADDWNVAQEVTVTAEQEDGDSDQDTATLTHTPSGADYAGVTGDQVTVTVNDDDAPAFSTSADTLTLIERSDANPTASTSYTVVLDTLPVGGDVTITVSVANNSDIKIVDPSDAANTLTELELEFTTSNWNQPQSVTLLALNDPDALDESGSLNHVASGANYGGRAPDVRMSISINDTTLAAVGIDPTTLSMTEGRTATYGVVLQSQPLSTVVITVASSDPGAVSAAPGRMTFTSSTWDQEQTVTLTAVPDPDADNESATISHSSSTSSDIAYASLTDIDSVSVTVVEDGTARTDTSSFLQSSSCDGNVTLTWNSPTSGEAVIASYRIEWRASDQQYDSSRSLSATADSTSYVLTSLMNDVQYSVRVVGLDDGGNPLWSRETTATPTSKSCISDVTFGNVLYDSAPVIVTLDDPEPGTQVNLRHRSLNPGVWSETQSKRLEPNQGEVTFDVRGLVPDHEYEVQTWLGAANTPPSTDEGTASIAQTIFSTPAAPEGVTVRAGSSRGGAGSLSRILRIEPSIVSVRLGSGDEVVLSVEVWGRQDIADNDLADKAPEDGRPEFVWTVDGGGSFMEGRVRPEWSDGLANDREVIFTAPDSAGEYTVTVSLADSPQCLSVREDETAQDHLERCTAQIEVVVKRGTAVSISTTAPVNPPGTIPETLTDSDGIAYAVFTPVEGGSFVGDGFSVTAGPGAVANGEFIGMSMTPTGDASNVGMTWHRYTLAGQTYSIGIVDSTSEPVSDYSLGEPVVVCVPMPDELVGNISDIVLVHTAGDAALTVLSTRVRITPDGPPAVCGALSAVPANVAVGKEGPPPEPPEEEIEMVEELPDTGGAKLAVYLLAAFMLIGVAGAIAGRRMYRPRRASTRHRAAR